MNIKRYLIAVAAVYVAFQVMDIIIHWVILSPVYATLASLWRQDMMSYMWIMYIAGLIMTFLFIYIFIKGYEGKGIMEGIRFGLVIGLFMQIPSAFGGYAMYPIPFSLALQWFIYGMIEFIVAGIIAAAIYRPKA